MKVYFNGKLEKDAQLLSTPFFKSLEFGQSVFETMRTYDLEIFELESHLDRLFDSVKILDFRPVIEKLELRENCLKWNKESANKNEEQRIKIFLTADFYWVRFEKLESPTNDFFEKGVVVQEMEFERNFPEAKYPSPAYKIVHQKQAEGVFETLFFNNQGFLREGNISNVFAVIDGVLKTPGKGVLKGVTRERVLQIATQKGWKVAVTEIGKAELKTASEIFLTNTTKEIVPVRQWEEWENEDFKKALELKKDFLAVA